MTPDQVRILVRGMPAVYKPDNEVFIILCSCPSSYPRHHTLSAIWREPDKYRMPTQEELNGYYGRKGACQAGNVRKGV